MNGKITNAAFLFAAVWAGTARAETRIMGVCEALNSAFDHQSVVIRSRYEMGALSEGIINDPCPGWPVRFFTAPAVIPVFAVSYAGIFVSREMSWACLDFDMRRRKIAPTGRRLATVKGILIRRSGQLLLGFRGVHGEYVGWGEGLYGGYAAVLVITAVPTEQ